MNSNDTNPEVLMYATDAGEESALKDVLQKLIGLGVDAGISFDLSSGVLSPGFFRDCFLPTRRSLAGD